MATIEDNELPLAIVQRIFKSSIPENISVGKDAKTAMLKSSTVFINYLTATANELAKAKHQKMINGNVILEALEEMEFADFIPHLRTVLENHQQEVLKKRNSSSSKPNIDTENVQDVPLEEETEEGVEEEKEAEESFIVDESAVSNMEE